MLVCLISGHISVPAASLTIDRTDGIARVTLSGSESAYYTILGATNAEAANWDFLVGFSYPHMPWYDAESALLPRRFYKSAEFAVAPSEFAADFRLIDHAGRSRWLYYHFNNPAVRAVVLIFTGSGCGKVREMINTVKALNSRFAPQGVAFWLVDSNNGDTRSNIIAEAVALGIPNTISVLHDPAQVVGHTYNASKTPEAIGIDTSNFNIFYRGAIDDRLASNAVATTHHYLSNAVVNFLAGQHISLIRSRPTGCEITYRPAFPNISYSTEIAPLLQAKCVSCHSPGNIAPWAMTNYQIVAAVAGEIKAAVMHDHMPPWHADPYYGTFTNDASLTPEQQRKLIQWIDEGAPRGSGPDPLLNTPITTNYPFAWPQQLGPPDTIVSIPRQSIPATGIVDYRYFNVATPFPSNVWLRAAVVLPENIKAVHHVLVFSGSSGSLNGLDGFFSGFVPGTEADTFPAGTGKLLTPRETLRFQMHYVTTGQPESDQTRLGLYLSPTPPTYPLQTKSAYDVFFSVPPNTADYTRTARYPASGTLNTNILIYEMSPHMHLRGATFKYEVVYPAGHVPSRETILSVPNYIFHWQRLYRLTQPKRIPRGSYILCTAGWDNTAQNVELMSAYYENNEDPAYSSNRAVGFGDQTYDEMFIGYFNFAEVP